MRALLLGLFACALVVGCASASRRPKKPSPCHYPQTALAQTQRF
jgi:uncharacterized protein YceK